MASGSVDEPSATTRGISGGPVGWEGEVIRLAIPGYEIIRLWRATALSLTFTARRLESGLRVLLKVFKNDENEWKRAEGELGVLSNAHPRIIRIVDAGVVEGDLRYAAIPFADAYTLMEYGRRADSDRLLLALAQLCEALHSIHLLGIAHGDLHPDELLVDELNGLRIPALSFVGRKGVGRAGEGVSTARISERLPIADPEQMRPAVWVDDGTDIHAVGVMLFQLFAGGQYPSAVIATPGEVVERILSGGPRLLRAVSSFHSRDEVEWVIRKAINEDASQRYQSLGELGRDLARVASGSVSASPTPIHRSFLKRLIPKWLRSRMSPKSRPPRLWNSRENRLRVRAVYNSLSVRLVLPAWEALTADRQEWFNRLVATATMPRDPSEKVSEVLLDHSRVLAAIESIPAILKRIEFYLGHLAGSPPPPADDDVPGGWDDEFELRKTWAALVAEQRCILRFLEANADELVNYNAIASNMSLPTVAGGRRTEYLSNRSIARHCKPMESPPLSLIGRDGKRGSLHLTFKGERIVRLHAER